MQHLDNTNKRRKKRSFSKAVLITLALIIVAVAAVAALLLSGNRNEARPVEPVETATDAVETEKRLHLKRDTPKHLQVR